MTITDRNNKLKHFITCLKCEVSGKPCDDNCSTQYDVGNMGEIIENLEAISKELEKEPCEDAISRQVAIDAFSMFAGYESNRTNAEWVDRIRVVLSSLPPVTPKQRTGRWIHVSEERLPKESDGTVLITVNGEVRTGQYSEFNNTWYKGDMGGVGGNDPIAWMSLPLCYEPQEREAVYCDCDDCYNNDDGRCELDSISLTSRMTDGRWLTLCDDYQEINREDFEPQEKEEV